VLVDGYFSTLENMLASSHILRKYRALIEYAVAIPGYGGDLLIKSRPEATAAGPVRERRYDRLAGLYDRTYFLTDCEGYGSFKRSSGRDLVGRLAAVCGLVDPRPGQRILDVGCGRGELAFALARAGADVTGVDYAADAVAIAERTYRGESVSGRLRYRQADVLHAPFDDRFDCIVASDLVEHLEPDALDRLLGRAADLLNDGGRLVVHTAPNLLEYRHAYAARRKLARAVGLYMPPSPRTLYEDLMHINEQTPVRLRRALRCHFTQTLVWTSDDADPAGWLGRRPTRRELGSHRSIFGVAGRKVDAERTRQLLRQERLDPARLVMDLVPVAWERTMRPGARYAIAIEVGNGGSDRLASLPPYPVRAVVPLARPPRRAGRVRRRADATGAAARAGRAAALPADHRDPAPTRAL
jgi:2-polyprenyl-3-methyl-5-hydroxy-6-metoxy-1,4-benzoquinol methylase